MCLNCQPSQTSPTRVPEDRGCSSPPPRGGGEPVDEDVYASDPEDEHDAAGAAAASEIPSARYIANPMTGKVHSAVPARANYSQRRIVETDGEEWATACGCLLTMPTGSYTLLKALPAGADVCGREPCCSLAHL